MSIYSNYNLSRDQPRDLMIVARWEDDESPLGRLFGWKREVDIYGNYVHESSSIDSGSRSNGNGSNGNEGNDDKEYCVDNSFLFGFILGIGMGLMIADFHSMKQSLSLRGAL